MDTEKKTCSVHLRLTPEEKENLAAKAKKAGMSRNSYCRKVLEGSQVQEAPTVDTGRLIQALTRTAYELNQLQSQDRWQDDGLEEKIRNALRDNQTAVQEIFRAYGVTY